MRTLGNIIWHIPFLGFLTALGTFFVGMLFSLTVIGVPIGLDLIQLSKFLLTPFSSAMVSKQDLNVEENKLWQSFNFIVWIFYLQFALFLVVVIVSQIASLFTSIVGIPAALVLAKSLGTYFNPVDKICVPVEVRNELERRKAREQVSRYN